MRAFGLIGTMISLAIVGYLVITRIKTSPNSQSAKLEALKKEHGIDIPSNLGGDLTKLPAALQKTSKKDERTHSNRLMSSVHIPIYKLHPRNS
jgi:hypothetical protein